MDGALVVFVEGLLALRLTGGLAQGLNFATDLLRGTGFAFHGTDYTKSTLHMPLQRELRRTAGATSRKAQRVVRAGAEVDLKWVGRGGIMRLRRGIYET